MDYFYTIHVLNSFNVSVSAVAPVKYSWVPHHTIWEQKGEEYRLSGVGGWTWSGTRNKKKRKYEYSEDEWTNLTKRRRKSVEVVLKRMKSRKGLDYMRKDIMNVVETKPSAYDKRDGVDPSLVCNAAKPLSIIVDVSEEDDTDITDSSEAPSSPKILVKRSRPWLLKVPDDGLRFAPFRFGSAFTNVSSQSQSVDWEDETEMPIDKVVEEDLDSTEDENSQSPCKFSNEAKSPRDSNSTVSTTSQESIVSTKPSSVTTPKTFTSLKNISNTLNILANTSSTYPAQTSVQASSASTPSNASTVTTISSAMSPHVSSSIQSPPKTIITLNSNASQFETILVDPVQALIQQRMQQQREQQQRQQRQQQQQQQQMDGQNKEEEDELDVQEVNNDQTKGENVQNIIAQLDGINNSPNNSPQKDGEKNELHEENQQLEQGRHEADTEKQEQQLSSAVISSSISLFSSAIPTSNTATSIEPVTTSSTTPSSFSQANSSEDSSVDFNVDFNIMSTTPVTKSPKKDSQLKTPLQFSSSRPGTVTGITLPNLAGIGNQLRQLQPNILRIQPKQNSGTSLLINRPVGLPSSSATPQGSASPAAKLLQTLTASAGYATKLSSIANISSISKLSTASNVPIAPSPQKLTIPTVNVGSSTGSSQAPVPLVLNTANSLPIIQALAAAGIGKGEGLVAFRTPSGQIFIKASNQVNSSGANVENKGGLTISRMTTNVSSGSLPLPRTPGLSQVRLRAPASSTILRPTLTPRNVTAPTRGRPRGSVKAASLTNAMNKLTSLTPKNTALNTKSLPNSASSNFTPVTPKPISMYKKFAEVKYDEEFFSKTHKRMKFLHKIFDKPEQYLQHEVKRLQRRRRKGMRSVFILDKYKLKHFARTGGFREMDRYLYNVKASGTWPEGFPRPSFQQAWRDRMAQANHISTVGHLLRVLHCCMKWDSINIRPPKGVSHTQTTSKGNICINRY